MASTKILIIDDEQDVIDLLTLHLRKAGYALSTVALEHDLRPAAHARRRIPVAIQAQLASGERADEDTFVA